MSSQARWRLLAIMIVSFVILGIIGWRSLPPPTPSPITIQVTPAVTTVTGSQTVVTPVRPTEWIKIGQVKPIGYYLSLLESNGTQPCIQLAKELTKLPDLTNATAVAKITWLALNATNPEVKEAFQLMIRGGTPAPSDFKYTVPEHNTELQILYWLACRNELRWDDTLALALAVANGIWITVGEDGVAEAVRKDASDVLMYLREVNELQREKKHQRLEDLPLEAKICISWTGGYSTSGGRPYALRRHTTRKLPLKGYFWNTVSLETLRKMRQLAEKNEWISSNVDHTVALIERYFYFGKDRRWIYTGNEENTIEVEGQTVVNHDMNNVDFTFRYYLENGKGIGDCGDESNIVDAFCKSWGIATTFVLHQSYDSEMTRIVWSHMKISYYDPSSKTWKICNDQLNVGINEPGSFTLYIYKPPVIQPDYLNFRAEPPFRFRQYGNMCYVFERRLSPLEIKSMFSIGIEASKMKRWLLYS